MSDIVKYIEGSPNCHTLTGASKEAIANAETELGTKFSKEYTAYLSAFSLASFNGHELTGIIPSPRLNVCKVTESQRAANSLVPNNLYVVERTDIDGIIIWQDSSGAIYQTAPDTAPKKVADSLEAYLKA